MILPLSIGLGERFGSVMTEVDFFAGSLEWRITWIL